MGAHEIVIGLIGQFVSQLILHALHQLIDDWSVLLLAVESGCGSGPSASVTRSDTCSKAVTGESYDQVSRTTQTA